MKTQEELWYEFGALSERLLHCRDIIQNRFENGLSYDEAGKLVSDFEMSLHLYLKDLSDITYEIKQYIYTVADNTASNVAQ